MAAKLADSSRDESIKDFLDGSFLPAASVSAAKLQRVVFTQEFEDHYQKVLANNAAGHRR
jgi:hypothetical protein